VSTIKKQCENCKFFRTHYNYEGAGCAVYDCNLPSDYAESHCEVLEGK
jgi:hypothetical protein